MIGASGNGGVGAVMVVAVAVEAAVAALVEAMVPLRMILCLQIVLWRFPLQPERKNR